MTRRLAIIPARGGSKRIPNKNIRDFCGKPMIVHSLQVAKESKLFDLVHVSSESDEILKISEDYGIPTDFKRPIELADDHTPIMAVLKYVSERYAGRGIEFDEIWLLMACAPLVKATDLIDAEKLFSRHGEGRSVIAVAPYPVPIEWAYNRDENGALSPNQEGMFAVRSQDINEKYYDAGAFAVFPSRRVMQSHGAGSDTNYIGHILPPYKAIDIDTEEDWKMAEALSRALSLME